MTILNKIAGILFVGVIATVAYALAHTSTIKQFAISPLIIGMVLGMTLANSLCLLTPQSWRTGIQFCGKNLLRVAIVLYGFRITLQDIQHIGLTGTLVAGIMLTSTMLLGSILGIRWLKMDRDTSLLVAAGSAVCGAAAVLATEDVLKSEAHKTAVAIGTVVVFGTLSMFLYPLMFTAGVLDVDSIAYGLYVGGSVHEVAQVVTAGSAVDALASNTAVIVKMTRVIMIVPLLLILSWWLAQLNKKRVSQSQTTVNIPWFALLFLCTVGFNSLHLLPIAMVNSINHIDTFLLTVAMTALGMETHFSKFKQAGLKPILLALILFIWLVLGGYYVVHLLVG